MVMAAVGLSQNVGALRALSPDVDTTIRSRHEWRRLYESRQSA